MPFLDTNEVRLHHQVDGDARMPWLILSNSLGTTLEMWEPQMPALSARFRVVRYDTRGHGNSSIPTGPYTIDQLGNDVIALMEELGINSAHFCGLSMGGMTGIWLGIHAPARINRLVLCNTSARIGPPETWNTRIEKVNSEGMAAIVPAVIERWFTPDYVSNAPESVDKVQRMLRQTDPAGYTANCAAIRDMDQRDQAASIKVPTLVITGTHDKATPAQDGKWLAEQIPHAMYVELDAAHLSNWEQSDQFNANLLNFLSTGELHG
jgi:3-oxoadipate enol-lactonase